LTISTETKDARAVSGQSNSHGSASAPAPAREDWKPSRKLPEFQAPQVADHAIVAPAKVKLESGSHKTAVIPMETPKIEPPTFAALAVKDHEESDGSGKKAYVLIAVVVLATIFTGYVVYQKTHTAGVQPPKPAEVSIPTPSATTSAASPVSVSPTPEPAQANSAATQEIVLATPKATAPASVADVTVHKPTAAIHTSTAVAPSADSQDVTETIIVKNSPKSSSKSDEADMAPPQAIGMPSDSQSLSGIVAITPAAVAKPAITRVKVSQGVSQGLLMKRVQPVYPSQALQMRIEGTVLLDANIGKDGRISGVRVLKGDNILAKAATDAVKQWKYNPYFLNGEPVEIQTQISVTFKLP
jgi:protein TonB